MAQAAGASRYTRVAITLHWLTAAAIPWNIVGGIGRGFVSDDAAELLFSGHKALGVMVLFLTAFRLVWRLTHRPPPLPPMPRWQVAAAHALHSTFYLLLVLMPLSGWVFTSAAVQRRPLTFFGLFGIPYLPVPQEAETGAVPHAFHVYAGWIMGALVTLHVAAALKHHFVDRDRTLVRMLPVARLPGR